MTPNRKYLKLTPKPLNDRVLETVSQVIAILFVLAVLLWALNPSSWR